MPRTELKCDICNILKHVSQFTHFGKSLYTKANLANSLDQVTLEPRKPDSKPPMIRFQTPEAAEPPRASRLDLSGHSP